MALTVGELVAYIRADGSQFDSQVDKSGQKFQALGSTISTGTKTIATAFTAVTAASLAVGTAVFKVGADYNRLQQSSRAALSTLLGSAEAANAQMDKLDAFAKNSPFAKQVFISAQQQLLGFGVQAEKVLPILDAVQNAVAAVGGSNDQVSQVTYALAQMQGQGKLTGETLNQLGQYGIDAAGIVGAEMGKTGAEIRDMASKPGGISVDKVWDPLANGLMERFGGATANIKLQYDGAVDRIKGATRDIGSTLAAPFIDPKGGGMAVEWANKVADMLRALETKAKPLVDILVVRLGPAFARITPGLEAAKSAINGWDLSKVNGQIDTLVKYAPLVAGTSAALLALGGNSLGLAKLGLSLNPVVAGIAALVLASPELRTVGRDFMTALQPVLPLLSEVGQVTADVAMELLRVLAPALGDLGSAAAPVIVALATGLTPALVGTLEALVPLAEVAADVVGVIAEIPTPILIAAAAFAALHQVQGPLQSGIDALGLAFQNFRERAAVQAHLGGVSTGMGMLSTASMAAKTGVSQLGTALKTAFISNPIGIAIAAITTAFGFFATAQANARQKAKDLMESLDQTTAAITEQTRALMFDDLVGSDRYENIIALSERLGLTMSDVVSMALGETTDATARLNSELDTYREKLHAGDESTQGLGMSVEEVRIKLRAFSDLQFELGDRAELTAEQQEALRAKLEAVGGAGQVAAAGIDEATRATKENADANLSQAEAALRAQDANASAADAILRMKTAQEEANRVNGDASATEEQKAAATKAADDATRNAEQSILSNVRAQMSSVEAMQKNNATNQELIVAVMGARQSFIDQQVSMGKTREEARRLADQYGLIPSSVITNVSANMGDAEGKIRAFVQTWNGHRVNIYFDAKSGTQVNGVGFNSRVSEDGSLSEQGNGLKAFANGGLTGAGAGVPRVPQIQRGGANVLWAEDSTIWEAYISGKPSMRNRNLAIWEETGRRLGAFQMPTKQYANGGTTAPAVQSAGSAGASPITVQLYGVPMDAAEEVAEAVAWELAGISRGGRYRTGA